jgi:hypothetical protein
MPTAILSALLIFLSVQFFTIGVILDAIKNSEKRQKQAFY